MAPPLDGPFERGLFGLVIDPERADDYEALHANPWPDLMEAIEASGFRKYQGFRRGAHVVYYGEFYPDMKTVFARMAEHEVNARWGDGVRGDHHHDHRRRGQPAHRRRDLPPGLTMPESPAGPRPRVGVVHPYWTLWEHTAGPTFRADRMALARAVAAELADTIDPVAVVEIASAEDGGGRRAAVRGPRRRGGPRAADDGGAGGLDDGRDRRPARRPGRRLGAPRDRSRRRRLRPWLHHDAGRDRRRADALQPPVAGRSTVRAGAGASLGRGGPRARARCASTGRDRPPHRAEPARADRPAGRRLRPCRCRRRGAAGGDRHRARGRRPRRGRRALPGDRRRRRPSARGRRAARLDRRGRRRRGRVARSVAACGARARGGRRCPRAGRRGVQLPRAAVPVRRADRDRAVLGDSAGSRPAGGRSPAPATSSRPSRC